MTNDELFKKLNAKLNENGTPLKCPICGNTHIEKIYDNVNLFEPDCDISNISDINDQTLKYFRIKCNICKYIMLFGENL